MNKYRISKYNPKYRNSQGIYIKKEWTSYCDIGEKIENTILKKEEYLNIEKLYCEIVSEIAISNNINKLIIDKLESSFSKQEIKNFFQEKNLKLELVDEELMDLMCKKQELEIQDLKRCLRLLLREVFWCELIGVNIPFKIVCGYDLYIYVYCDNISKNIIDKYMKKGIFVEIM